MSATEQPLATSPNDGVTTARERRCPACGVAFPARGRRRWCSDTCRQRGFRLRHGEPDETPPLLPRRLPKATIVYFCEECEIRYLGIQQCEECNAFCIRLGPGGPCPHCDEPVAMADLNPAHQETG